jgi:hypothetical protein
MLQERRPDQYLYCVSRKNLQETHIKEDVLYVWVKGSKKLLNVHKEMV